MNSIGHFAKAEALAGAADEFMKDAVSTKCPRAERLAMWAAETAASLAATHTRLAELAASSRAISTAQAEAAVPG